MLVAMATILRPITLLQELEGRVSDEESSSDDDWNTTVEPKITAPVKAKNIAVEMLPLSQTDRGAAKKKHSK